MSEPKKISPKTLSPYCRKGKHGNDCRWFSVYLVSRDPLVFERVYWCVCECHAPLGASG